MKLSYLLSLTAFTASAAFAQATPTTAGAAASAPGYMPYADLSKTNPDEVRKAKEMAEAMVKDMVQTYETKRTPEMEAAAEQARRKADAIADSSMAEDRDKVLEFLGLDPQADTALYYFVSWSMPIEMLRSYAVEAMWSGGSLIFKGVPPGKELVKFIVDDLRQLVYGKGASANISIDPRLYDAYEVKSVPTIVFTTVRSNMQCQGLNPVAVKVEDRTATYDTCPALTPDKYWKVTGSVTSGYALQAFIDSGATLAQPYLKAISRGWAGLNAPGKEQQPFTGKWNDALSPSEQMAVRDAAKALTGAAQAVPKP